VVMTTGVVPGVAAPGMVVILAMVGVVIPAMVGVAIPAMVGVVTLAMVGAVILAMVGVGIPTTVVGAAMVILPTLHRWHLRHRLPARLSNYT
jgi:sterol desaturase/sphingolipid hydroxylase (fatty acid hydroxylase superfamily)